MRRLRATSSSGRLVGRDLLITAGAAHVFFATYAMSLPVVPRFVTEHLGGGDASVGAVFGVYALGGILVRPLVGPLGDRFGRRLLMIGGGTLTALALASHLLVDGTVALSVVRAFAGAGQAAVVVGATTLALDLAPVARRGEAASYLMVAIQLGMGTGPLVGELILDAFSYDGVWIGSTVGALLCAGAALLLPWDAPSAADEPANGRPMAFHPAGLRPGVTAALGTIGFMGFLAFVPLLAVDLDMKSVGALLLVTSVTAAGVRFAGARFLDRTGPIRAGATSAAVMAAGLFLVAGTRSAAGVYGGAIVLAFGHAFSTPSMVLAASRVVPARERARMLATLTLFIDAATAFGPALLGLVAAVGGYQLAFTAAGMSPLLGVFLVLWWIRPWLAASSADCPVTPDLVS